MGRPPRSLHVAEHGAGPAVLLVHGQPGLGTDWDGVTDLLVEDHRVVVPDRPGYGSSGEEPASMAANADVLAQVLADLGSGPAVVVGHSYGGGIAVLMADRHPDVVRGLVLVGSVGIGASVNGLDRMMAWPAVGEVLSAGALFAVGRVLPLMAPLGTVLPAGAEARLRATLPDRRHFSGPSRLSRRVLRSFVSEQRALVSEIGDVERALGRIRRPTIVMAGTWDVVVPTVVAAAIAAQVPAAELVTLSGAGHFLPRDAPSAVAEAVRRVEERSAR
ncbi:MAG TPA: alpha/beta hydrolase [Acidimicrobiales bacterium]|nr:alpha/beta hydrolase [Acidimicrobiales bacterium]